MKSVEDKTCDIFKFLIREKYISILIYVGISNEKCGRPNLECFQISYPWKKFISIVEERPKIILPLMEEIRK